MCEVLSSRVAQLVVVDLGNQPARVVEIVQGRREDQNFEDFTGVVIVGTKNSSTYGKIT